MKNNKGKNNKDRKSNRTVWFLSGVSGMFSAVAGLKFFEASENANGTYADFILTFVIMIFAIYISMFIHIIIHETGHLVFGLATGYRFSSFRIANIMLAKVDGKFCIKKHSVKGTAGQCLMAPPEYVEGKIPYVMYNLGGVIFNIILSLISLVLFFSLKPDSLFATALLLFFSSTGFALAFTNGFPVKNRFMINDGGNILGMKNNSEAIHAFYGQLKVYEALSHGIRLKDMPDDYFRIPDDEKMKDGLMCADGVFACLRMIDKHDFDSAEILMDKLLNEEAGTVEIHRRQLICNKIYFELISDNNPEVIKNLIDKPQKSFMNSMKSDPSVMRTNYALAVLNEKNKEKAQKIRKEFEKREKTYAFSADMQTDRELIEIVDSRAKQMIYSDLR